MSLKKERDDLSYFFMNNVSDGDFHLRRTAQGLKSTFLCLIQNKMQGPMAETLAMLNIHLLIYYLILPERKFLTSQCLL